MNSQTCLHRSLVSQSIIYESSTDVVYMNNAKAGCSTIKSTILKRSQEMQSSGEELHPKVVHGNIPYWCKDFSRISDEKTFVFSVVRNPFSRVLSAFLDKIGQANLMRSQFYWQHSLDLQEDITFVEFLRLLKKSNSLFDQHWRPQVANLYAGFMPLDEVHFIENFDKTQNSVCDRLGGISSFVRRGPHATNALDRVAEYVNDEAIDLIVDLYHEDFSVFGYSTEVLDANCAPETILTLPKKSPVLTDMLAQMKESQTPAQTLRLSLHALGLVGLTDDAAFANKGAWQQKLVELSLSEAPSTRYLALSVLASSEELGQTSESKLKSLTDIVQMAPYQIGNHAALAKYLARIGRTADSQDVLDNLMKMTWQKDMVRNLKKQLAASAT